MTNEIATDVQALFDRKANSWQSKYQPRGALRDRLARFADQLRRFVPPPATVLDFGCGTGDLARFIAAQNYRPVACDFAPGMLERARQATPGREVEWVSLDARWSTLPFTANQFDAIVASSVFEYLDRPEHVIAESARVLRADGVLLCTVPDPSHWVRKFEAVIAALASWTCIRSIARLIPRVGSYLLYVHLSGNRFSPDEWRRMFSSAGFESLDDDSLLSSVDGRRPLLLLAFRKLPRSCQSCSDLGADEMASPT